MNTLTSWPETEISPEYASLRSNLETEVLVVGAGVIGLTTALRLQRAGRRVAVVTAHRVASGIGDGATPLTELLDSTYQVIESRFGFREASLAATSTRLAINCIEKLSKELRVRFERVPTFLFAESEQDKGELDREYQALKRVGSKVQWLEKSLPLPVTAAVRVDDQALFEPRAYVQALAKLFIVEGGQIFEDTEVLGIDDHTPCIVQTREGTVQCRDVVITAPSEAANRFLPQTAAEQRTATPAPPMASDLPSGLYVDIREPGRCTYASAVFGPSSPVTRHIVTSLDGLPLVGLADGADHVFVATGFGNADITFATVGAMLLSDSVRGVSNACETLLDPARPQTKSNVTRRKRAAKSDGGTDTYVRH